MKGSEPNGGTSSSGSKGESHRIYWQQWPSSTTAASVGGKLSRRDLITSSAAIRISPDGARAQDVTKLLCETLNLTGDDKDTDNPLATSPRQESWDKVQDAWEQDSLVLVGTLYSLPLHYVRFEHERIEIQHQQQQPTSSDANIEEASVNSSSSGGKSGRPVMKRNDPPFHVIKTLSATENPVQVRNAMIQLLERILEQSTVIAFPNQSSRATNSISPKLQWYFVPGMSHPSSPIPSYIDLDGYSTSMEDEGDMDADDEDERSSGDADDKDHDSEHDDDPDEIVNFPLSPLEDHSQSEGTYRSVEERECTTEKERIFRKERQRYFELATCQSSLHHDCVSGYLLKQSMTDPQVWKRVHCVLTDDHFWFITRVYTRLYDEPGEEKREETKDEKQKAHRSFFSYAKHRRLGLTRALLLQPSSDRPTAPLSRTPSAFEVIASNGVAHRFRASDPDTYKRWVNALSSRIVQSFENSLFEHAELIVRDETEARQKRFMTLAVQPLWEHQKGGFQRSGGARDVRNNPNERHIRIDSPTMKVLRYGIEVTEFRERCRHIQAILPPKYPVLAMTNDPATDFSVGAGPCMNGPADHTAIVGPSSNNGALRLDPKTQALIKSAWDEAIRLGSRATKLAVELQSSGWATSSNNNGHGAASGKMPGSLEAICQHLEYVITGNFPRSQQGNNSRSSGRTDNTRTFPPPIEMFDILLTELQAIAAGASIRSKASSSSQSPTTTEHNDCRGAPPIETKPIMNGSASQHLQK